MPDFLDADVLGYPDIPDVVEWLRDHPAEWAYATLSDALEADSVARRVLDEVLRRIRDQ